MEPRRDAPSLSGEKKTAPPQPEVDGTCPRCGRTLRERSCKLICDRCGYYMSCSDF